MHRHILVVALNPSIDVEWRVPRVRWGEKNEIVSERRWPGGKGVNVARWLKHLGARPRLLLPLGGRHGEEMAAGLEAERLPSAILQIRGQSRANVIVTGPPEGQLRFNPAGPELSRSEWTRIQSMLSHELRAASLLILSGSLPRGLETDAYSVLTEIARKQKVACLLDCDGKALARAVHARPFLVKPNHHELAEWIGHPLNSAQHIETAAKRLSEITSGWVLVSKGPDGGILVGTESRKIISGRPPRVAVQNTVGAGDALLAAIAHQITKGAAPENWMRAGLGAGTSATTSAAGELPSRMIIRRMIDGVRIESTSGR